MEGQIIFSGERLKEAIQDLKERDPKLYNHIERALFEIKSNFFAAEM